jgi:hypothetical protein
MVFSGAFLASLLHHRLGIVQEGQLVSVARLLHCSLVVSDFLVKLLRGTSRVLESVRNLNAVVLNGNLGSKFTQTFSQGLWCQQSHTAGI